MASDNVEHVRALLEAWNRRDLELMLAGIAPDVEYVNSPDAVEPGTRHGHEGMSDVLTKQWDLLDAHLEIDELYALGESQVVFEGRITRSMPGSEATIDALGVMRWTVGDDGLVTRIEILGAGSSFQAGVERLRDNS